MPAKNAPHSYDIYQLKITDLTLADIHGIIQAVMEWDDSHLHSFSIGDRRFSAPDPDDPMAADLGFLEERKARLSKVLGEAGAKAEYNYDFGDDWLHRIVVEKVLPPAPEAAYPVCTGGKLNGPPEDCGGVYGYYHLLDAIADPEYEDHEDLLEWTDGGYDPEAFSLDEINLRLAPAQRRWSIRSKTL
jgi:hypothetical protein